jgi:hypothetical protein
MIIQLVSAFPLVPAFWSFKLSGSSSFRENTLFTNSRPSFYSKHFAKFLGNYCDPDPVSFEMQDSDAGPPAETGF